MKVGVIGAGTMGQGIAKAFAQVDGYEVALCDIKQEWAEGGKDKIAKGYARLVAKEKMTQEKVDGILAKITPGLKEDLCKDCDLIVEAAFEDMSCGPAINWPNHGLPSSFGAARKASVLERSRSGSTGEFGSFRISRMRLISICS